MNQITPGDPTEIERVKNEVAKILDELYAKLAPDPTNEHVQDVFVTAVCAYMFDKSDSFNIGLSDLISLINIIMRVSQAKQMAAKIQEAGGLDNYLKDLAKKAGLDKIVEALKAQENTNPRTISPEPVKLEIDKKPGEADIIKFPGSAVFEDRSSEDDDNDDGGDLN